MILETAITTVSREVRMDGCIETSQIVCTCDKNILYAPIPQTIQYGRPEPCALILADPHPQNIFAAVQIKADGNAHCFLYDLPFAADMVVDRIQKNYGIDRFHRPLLPFFRHRQDLIRDPAYRSVRHRQPVQKPCELLFCYLPYLALISGPLKSLIRHSLGKGGYIPCHPNRALLFYRLCGHRTETVIVHPAPYRILIGRLRSDRQFACYNIRIYVLI